MMDKVGNDVGFLFDQEGVEPVDEFGKPRVAELEGSMGAVAMIPEGVKKVRVKDGEAEPPQDP